MGAGLDWAASEVEGRSGNRAKGGLLGRGLMVFEEEDVLAGNGRWEAVSECDGGNGVRVEKMAQEMDGIDLMVAAVAGAEFGMEGDVTKGIDARVRFERGPFDGAIDVGIMKSFVHVAPIAGDLGAIPAVDVSGLRVCGILE